MSGKTVRNFFAELVLLLQAPIMIIRAQQSYSEFKEDLFKIYRMCNDVGPVGYNQGKPIDAYLELHAFVVFWLKDHLAKLNEFLRICSKVKFGRFKTVYNKTETLKAWLLSVTNAQMIEVLPDGTFKIKQQLDHPEIKAAHTLGITGHMLGGLVGSIDNTVFHGTR